MQHDLSMRGTADPLRSRRGVAAIALVACAVIVPTACGEPEELSLCTAFADFLDVRADVQSIDLEQESAAEALEHAENYLARVRRLKAAADGRYGQQLDDLESRTDDIIRTLASVQEDADVSVWLPLIEDDLELGADAAAALTADIEPSCTPDTSD